MQGQLGSAGTPRKGKNSQEAKEQETRQVEAARAGGEAQEHLGSAIAARHRRSSWKRRGSQEGDAGERGASAQPFSIQ